MALVITDDKHYKAIADAIRSNLGDKTTYTPDKMAIGVTNSYMKGIADGYEDGLEEGIAQGKQAEHDTFWNIYQYGGQAMNGSYQFYSVRFDDTNFYPIYDIKPTNCQHMFNGCRVTNIKQRLEECGVVLDTSLSTDFTNTFYYCRSTMLPPIDTTSASTLVATFVGTYLVTLEKLILKDDGSQTFGSPFVDCISLKDISIEGVIGQSINFSACPLSYKSLMDSNYGILHHLKDYSGTGTTKTITFGATNLAKLTDAEKAIATQKGWTLA